MIKLEKSHVIKRKETKEDGANNTTEWDGAKAVSRVVGMRAFAIISGDEQFPLRDDDVDLAGGMFFRTVGLGSAGGIVWMKAIGIIAVIDSKCPVFDSDTLTGEGNNAFDDVLVIDTALNLTG